MDVSVDWVGVFHFNLYICRRNHRLRLLSYSRNVFDKNLSQSLILDYFLIQYILPP